MGTNKHRQPIGSMGKEWPLLVGICASPLYFLFAYFGDPGRGQAATVCAIALAFAARPFWDLRNRVWYWITLVVITLLHILLILLVPWPYKQLSYVALLPAWFVDFVVAYKIIRLVENVVEKNASPETGVSSSPGG